jgi:hypothetical protein
MALTRYNVSHLSGHHTGLSGIRHMTQGSTETENETRSAARERDPSASSQVSVAEDARFELARGCPQHAFQQCWPVFTGVRHRP